MTSRKINTVLFGMTVAAGLIFLASCSVLKVHPDTYEPRLESLARHTEAPEWFQDAKIGIYFHWGVYSVPAFGSEWYPRHMYIKDNPEYKHHVQEYGDPREFGYPDFVPLFKAEHFNADEWALLFKKAGARFAGPVAEHHDGFSMWDSQVTPWNAADMGPGRDISGELAKAIRRQGMRFITTFHHARNNLWESAPGKWVGHYEYVKKDFPTLLEDEKRAILYGYMPREKFVKMWKNKLIEVIDSYQPDIMWFDSWLDEIPETDRFEYIAYYLNQAQKRNQEVVIVRKQNDLPLEFSVLDHEKSRMSRASKQVWMTDDTISTGSWCYTKNLQIKPARDVIHALADTVSKNGIVLLNISPKADGTIPEDQRKVLLELGDWLNQNGEAIYSTRPWITYGEGPTKEPEGGFSEHEKFLNLKYSAKDIRYTCSKDGKAVYAICLGWPDGPLHLQAVCVAKELPDAQIQLLGSPQKVDFKVNPDKTLTILPPQLDKTQRPCQYAYAFKLTGFLLEAGPYQWANGIKLNANRAVLEGTQLRLEEQNERTNIGYWNDPYDCAHWLLRIPEAGIYKIQGEFAAVEDHARYILKSDGQEILFDVPNTKNWYKSQKTDIGSMRFTKPGVYHIILSTENPEKHILINVWQITFLNHIQ
ncbi:MAG: alpha-L-fucosidase [Sedimentisphaerales bacterium]|nr:alpha-L-fucosidase [Sedimentisphaerales bacterium]